MKEWWGWFNNPFVKGATGCALSLFVALNFPVIFPRHRCRSTVLCSSVGGSGLRIRNRYAIVGKSELVVRFAWRTFSGFREGCSQAVARTLRYEAKAPKQEKQRLRRFISVSVQEKARASKKGARIG